MKRFPSLSLNPGRVGNMCAPTLLIAACLAVAQAVAAAGPVTLRPIQDIHVDLLRKFTAVEQPRGDRGINHSGNEPFTGDCDDYYTAAFNQLYVYGYDPYAQILAVRGTGKPHIVACVDTPRGQRCLDHNRKRVSRTRDLARWYRILDQRRIDSADPG